MARGGGVGLVYDERMCEHKNVDDPFHPEHPERITSIFKALESAGIVDRYVTHSSGAPCLKLKFVGRIGGQIRWVSWNIGQPHEHSIYLKSLFHSSPAHPHFCPRIEFMFSSANCVR